MATLLNPFLRALDANADAVSGGLLYVFEAGTTTPVTTYSDRAMTTAQAQPLVANAAGEFASVFVPSGTYKIRVADSGAVVLYENDYVRMADRPDDPVLLDEVADVLTGTEPYAEGTYIKASREGAAYEALASGATNQHFTTPGGVKMRVQPFGGAYNAADFGSDAAALQSAIDASVTDGVKCVLPGGVFEFSDTLKLRAGLRLEGPSGQLSGTAVLRYTGTGDAMNSIDNSSRQLHLSLQNFCVECTNTSNTGTGINLETFGFARLENITVRGFDAGGGFATGVKMTSATGLLGVDSNIVRNVQVLYCGNGFETSGVSGSQVADCIFDTCGVNFMQNPDGTANSSAVAFNFDEYSDRIAVFGCYYKQDGSVAMDAAFDISGSYINLYGCMGEVNQSADELRINSSAVGTQIFGHSFQDRTRFVNSASAERAMFVTQSQPLTISRDSADSFDFIKWRKGGTEVCTVDSNGNWIVGAGAVNNPNSYGRIFNIQGFAPALVLSEDTGKDYTIGVNGSTLFIFDETTVIASFSGNDFRLSAGNLIFQTSTAGITYQSGCKDLSGSGTPEGAIVAPIGSTYRRSDGGAGTSFYVKESGVGSAGWVAK